MTLITEADPGVRLGRVRVSLDGELVGQSNEEGLLETYVEGSFGRRVRIEHDCPEGYRDPTDPTVLRLRHFRPVGASSVRGIEMGLQCPPQERLAAFVIRAKNGADLPILLNGKRMARTNLHGVAHFSTRGPPGTEYTVLIDTTANPRLRPQNPIRLFTLPDAHEVFVIAQAFETEDKRRPVRHRAPRITKIE